MRRAAVRFNVKPPGQRRRVWFDRGDRVPDEVAEMVEDRCLIGSDGVDDYGNGYPAGSPMDDVTAWLWTSDSEAELAGRSLFALREELKRPNGPRTTLIAAIEKELAESPGGRKALETWRGEYEPDEG